MGKKSRMVSGPPAHKKGSVQRKVLDLGGTFSGRSPGNILVEDGPAMDTYLDKASSRGKGSLTTLPKEVLRSPV